MSNMVNLISQLLQTALISDEQDEDAPFSPTDIQLTTDGAHIEGHVGLAQARGKIALDLGVKSPSEGQYVVSINVLEGPAELDPMLETFRAVVKSFESQLTLDFNDSHENS